MIRQKPTQEVAFFLGSFLWAPDAASVVQPSVGIGQVTWTPMFDLFAEDTRERLVSATRILPFPPINEHLPLPPQPQVERPASGSRMVCTECTPPNCVYWAKPSSLEWQPHVVAIVMPHGGKDGLVKHGLVCKSRLPVSHPAVFNSR